MFHRFRQYDAFAKTGDDYATRTVTGGIMTIVSSCIIIYLIWIEYLSYTDIIWKPKLIVDTGRKQSMDIHFNITFPHVPCFTVSLDVLDAASEHQMNIAKTITKTRLDQFGEYIGPESFSPIHQEIPSKPKDKKTKRTNETNLNDPYMDDPNYCGSCYGATTLELDGSLSCCNTCNQVKEAYNRKEMELPDLDMVEQCDPTGWKTKLETQSKEGCNLAGVITVNRIPGNFHFAPGLSFQVNSMHLHDLRPFRGMEFDFSHYIHHLSFGETHPKMVLPLNGMNKTCSGADDAFTYFVKVVSTEFHYLDGHSLITNQYSSTQHHRQVQIGVTGLSGVYFNVEISPMVVLYYEYHTPFTSLLTQICAIVGGIYTLASLFDALLWTAERRFLHKQGLGKAM